MSGSKVLDTTHCVLSPGHSLPVIRANYAVALFPGLVEPLRVIIYTVETCMVLRNIHSSVSLSGDHVFYAFIAGDCVYGELVPTIDSGRRPLTNSRTFRTENYERVSRVVLEGRLNAAAAAGGGTVTLRNSTCLLNSFAPSSHPGAFYNLHVPFGVACTVSPAPSVCNAQA
jgi:hypothetical protein